MATLSRVICLFFFPRILRQTSWEDTQIDQPICSRSKNCSFRADYQLCTRFFAYVKPLSGLIISGKCCSKFASTQPLLSKRKSKKCQTNPQILSLLAQIEIDVPKTEEKANLEILNNSWTRLVNRDSWKLWTAMIFWADRFGGWPGPMRIVNKTSWIKATFSYSAHADDRSLPLEDSGSLEKKKKAKEKDWRKRAAAAAGPGSMGSEENKK